MTYNNLIMYLTGSNIVLSHFAAILCKVIWKFSACYNNNHLEISSLAYMYCISNNDPAPQQVQMNIFPTCTD